MLFVFLEYAACVNALTNTLTIHSNGKSKLLFTQIMYDHFYFSFIFLDFIWKSSLTLCLYVSVFKSIDVFTCFFLFLFDSISFHFISFFIFFLFYGSIENWVAYVFVSLVCFMRWSFIRCVMCRYFLSFSFDVYFY